MSDMQISESSEIKKTLETEQRAKSGAGWFYWIAGLSMVNSIILLAGAGISFCIGLGITQIIDALAWGTTNGAQAVGLILNAMVAGMFVFLGVMARKRQPWAFITGLVLYGADALLFLIVSDWLSIAFHVWAFIGILSGLKATNQLLASQPQVAAPAAPLQPATPLQREQPVR